MILNFYWKYNKYIQSNNVNYELFNLNPGNTLKSLQAAAAPEIVLAPW